MFNFRISRAGFTTNPGGLSGSRELGFGINLGLTLSVRDTEELPIPKPRAGFASALGIYVPFPQLQLWLGFIPLHVCQGIIFLFISPFPLAGLQSRAPSARGNSSLTNSFSITWCEQGPPLLSQP